MKYICLELDSSRDAYLQLMTAFDESRDFLTDESGCRLIRMMNAMKTENGVRKTAYYYGLPEMKAYFQFWDFNGEPKTMAELSEAVGLPVVTNFTDSADYYWWFQSLFGLSSNQWYTVLTENDIRFYLPRRTGDSRQIIDYQIASEMRRESFFDSAGYEGEAGFEIQLGSDVANIVPAVINSECKERVSDKYRSKNGQISIVTQEDVAPLDYIIEESEVFVVMSKRLISQSGKQLYRLECVRESGCDYDFTGEDISFPPNVLNAQYLHATPWVRLTDFVNGWGNWFDTNDPDLAYTVTGGHYVWIKGLLSLNTATDMKVLTLPIEIRPLRKVRTTVISDNNAVGYGIITQTGELKVANYGAMGNWAYVNFMYDLNFDLG